MDKSFYVSPFIAPDGRYRVTVRDDQARLAIGISERDDEGPLLSTSVTLRRLPITTRNLVWLLVRYPLMTQRTTLLIHWHALRLWLKRVPRHQHGAAPTSRPRAHPPVAAHGARR
jgi:DUF1365 family protein